MPVLDIDGLIKDRYLAIREFHRNAGVPRAELDMSGGADSAVMAGLLTLALGPENITLVHSRINTNEEQTSRAKALAEGLGVPLINFDMTEIFDALTEQMGRALKATAPSASWWGTPNLSPGDDIIKQVTQRCESDPTIMGSLRSCIRAPIGRGFNRLMGNGIRHGTGNECEDRFLRYYQKGGDGEVDTNPMGFLSKSEVYQIAWGLAKKFPGAADAYKSVIRAKPSADLWGTGVEHSDEAELVSWLKAPLTYGRVDPETGDITQYGTIERVNRVLDLPVIDSIKPYRVGEWLFQSEELHGEVLARLITTAKMSGLFNSFSRPEVEALLLAARKAEATTRHKENPSIPTLGTRQDLVGQGLLSNNLKEEA